MALGIKYTTPYTTAGTKQFETLAFKHYQYKDTVIVNKVYWDDSSNFPISNIATGTNAQESVNLPVSGEIVYSPTTSAPLVGQARNVTKISATAADDGAELTVAWDMTNDDYFVIVLKSSGTSTAGVVNIKDSTGTAYSTCSFTTSATANTWEKFVFDFKNDSASNVAITGTPDYTDITDIEITLDTLSTDATVAMTYSVNNLNQVIGTAITLDYTTCPSASTLTQNFETTDLVCKQLTKRKIATGRAPTLELTNKTEDLLRSAAVNGSAVKRDSQYVFEKIYGTEFNSSAIAAGAISLGTGLVIGLVKIGERTLSPVPDATLVSATSYHYATSTGTMTFATSNNGETPTVWAENSVTLDNFDVAGLELGYIGRMYITRVSEQGTKIYNTAYKAQLTIGDESGADDGDEITTSFAFLPDSENRFMNKAIA